MTLQASSTRVRFPTLPSVWSADIQHSSSASYPRRAPVIEALGQSRMRRPSLARVDRSPHPTLRVSCAPLCVRTQLLSSVLTVRTAARESWAYALPPVMFTARRGGERVAEVVCGAYACGTRRRGARAACVRVRAWRTRRAGVARREVRTGALSGVWSILTKRSGAASIARKMLMSICI